MQNVHFSLASNLNSNSMPNNNDGDDNKCNNEIYDSCDDTHLRIVCLSAQPIVLSGSSERLGGS